MHRSVYTALAMTLVLALAGDPSIAADDGKISYEKHNGIRFESADGDFSINMGSRVQLRFTEEDPDVGDSKGSFDVRRAKFWLKGKVYQDWDYKLQVVWSGGSTELEDASFTFTRNKLAQLWVGQGKVLFGRQQLTSSGSQQFVDRSIIDDEFSPARSQGLALIGQTGNKQFEYNVGVYDDYDGQNVRANSDDHYMVTGRVVYTPFGEYKPVESSLDYPENSKLAVGVKLLDDTLDLGGGAQQDNTTFGVELAYKLKGFNLVAEYYDRSLETTLLPDQDGDGGYLQLAYLFPGKKSEIAGRYAVIRPDVVGASADESESGLAYSYYLHEHDYKIQVDYRSLVFDLDPALDRDELRAQLQFIF